MATLTGKRLAGPTQLGNTPATVYTVPPSTTTNVLQVRVCNTSGAAATFFLSIGADAAGTRLYSALSIPANTTITDNGAIYLAAGETLQAYSGTNAVLTLTISGVESS